ncbi:mucin-2 [Musca vetustissima]|uniref:mucin-2 n=1 Tax=Musca vetustissima TaxID=27455 RepID=UPI002AB7E89C|nr:mucin-2 [Musca vetustissima]
MDPSRHHEYITATNNDERSRIHTSAGYYSRDVHDISPHRYYGSTAAQSTGGPPHPASTGPPARSHSNTRIPCDCTTTPSGARITCNNCRLNPNGEMWSNAAGSSSASSSNSGPAAHEYHRAGGGDYRQIPNEATMRSGMRQNSMYIHQQATPVTGPPQHMSSSGPMQHHPGGPQPPPPPSNSSSTTSQTMMQSHTVSRSGSYWPQNPSSTSQHYGEEHIHGPGPGPGGHHPPPHHHHAAAAHPPPPHQATTQTQIDISITRRSSTGGPPPPSGATMDAGSSLYGQYKSHHSSHSGSSYPPTQPSSAMATSTPPIHHHQQQQQQRVSAIGSAGGGGSSSSPAMVVGNTHYITKEQRVYQTKYSSSTTTTTKIAYNATATSAAALYDGHAAPPPPPQHHNKTASALPPIDHHVINPSNLPASKEQHPSPNYARKCPQMYTPETAAAEQSTAHHHHNLYMPTPQFSSDKFSRASPQQLSSSAEYTKIRESPSGGGASPYGMLASDKYGHMSPSSSSSTPHLRESPQFVSGGPPPRNSNASYYAATNATPPNHHQHLPSSKVHPPEMSPIIMKQSPHPHYQYSSRSPLPPSASHHPHHHHHQIPPVPPSKINASPSGPGAGVLAAPPAPAPPPPQGNPPAHSAQRYLMDNVKREDLEIYESSPQHHHPARGAYINPYNTPPPAGGDTCCKEVVPLSTSSSPYTVGSSATPNNYRVESPQFYNTKYGGKMAAGLAADGSNKHAALLQQNTPPPSRAPSQRGGHPGQPAYYYDGNPHSAPSPAAATAASPSPSSSLLASSCTTTTSQTHIHHTEYVTTTLQQGPGGGGVHMSGPHPHSIPPPQQSSSYPPSQPTGGQYQVASLRNNEMLASATAAAPLPYERGPIHNHPPGASSMKHSQPNSTLVPVQQNVSSLVPPSHQQHHPHPPPPHHQTSKIPAAASGGNSAKNKPNYRELISRELAMRNATSETELNLKIIKKTLNVDSQNIRVPGAAAQPPNLLSNSRVAPPPPHAIVGGPPAVSLPQPTPLVLQHGTKLVNHHPAGAAASTTVPVIPRPAESSRIFIKQEDDKPSSSSGGASGGPITATTTSPLDLSMRTVKTKADSTEYKYPQRRSTPNLSAATSSSSSGAEGRYTLPRVDSTPVFSVHAFEPGGAAVDITASSSSSRRPSPHNSRHSSLERSSRNYTPPTRDIVMSGATHSNSVSPIGSSGYPAAPPHPAERHPSPYTGRRSTGGAGEIMMSSGSPHIKAGSMNSSPSLSSGYEPAAPSSCVIKTGPKIERDAVGPIAPHHRHNLPPHQQQTRPSVLETNPYASVIKSEPKPRIPLEVASASSSSSSISTSHHTLAAVERLPPDTSIMPLPLKNGNYGPMGKTVIPPAPASALREAGPSPSNTSQGCERNPNFRKRHIQEYSHQMSSASSSASALGEPLNKQSRYSLDSPKPPIIPMRPADISVIAVNESNQHELLLRNNPGGGVIASSGVKNQAPVIVNNVKHTSLAPLPVVDKLEPLMSGVVCKQEPLTPTGVVIGEPKPEPMITQTTTTTPTSHQPRIRTKAELKGFTFNPPPPQAASTTITPAPTPTPTPPTSQVNEIEGSPIRSGTCAAGLLNIKKESPAPSPAARPQTTPSPPPPAATPSLKIKEEEPESTVEELIAIPGLEEDFSEKNLLDFGWSNTCNNFVEQLITKPAKKSLIPGLVNINTAIGSAPVIKEEPKASEPAPPAAASLEKSKLNNEIAAPDTTSRTSFPQHFDGGMDSKSSSLNQDPLNSPSSSTGILHKKLNKLGREKKRYQQEKRLAERLQSNKDSSSETEDELDKRKTERLKKPLMKAKNKLKSKPSNTTSNENNSSSNQNQENKNQFSDCGSDSSSTSSSSSSSGGAQTDKKDKKLKPTTLTTLAFKKEMPSKLLNNMEKKGSAEAKEIKVKEEKKGEEEEKSKKKEEKTKLPEKDPKTNKIEIKKELPEAESEAKEKSKENRKANKTPEDKENPKKTPHKESGKSATSSSGSSSSSGGSASSSSGNSSSESDTKQDQSRKDKTNTSNSTSSSSPTKKPNNISGKPVGKFKIGLNTMTRSKLKKEMEAQMANSKVLRNDKIIRNSTTKIKRKYVRKYVNTVNSYLESGGLSRECGVIKSTRLKAKLERKVMALNHLKAKDKKLQNQNNNKIKNQGSKESGGGTPTKGGTNKPENLHDPNVLELYRFKRALKVPPSLISIKHPAAHKIAASLPDLERHASALDAKKKKKNNLTSNSNEKSRGHPEDEPISIIDLLHSRVTKASGLNVSNKSTTTTASKPANTPSNTPKSSSSSTATTTTSTPGGLSCVIGKNYANSSNNCGMFSETSQTTESSELQMLPPLRPSSDEDEDDDNESATSGKKRHFSIFETTVLPTKTRTESKMQQKRENIREIFVGDDRPASAPPEMTQTPDNNGGLGVEKMTYEQTYEQFLQKMNIVISSDKSGRFSRTAGARKLLLPTSLNSNNSSSLNIKQEEVDTESTSVMDPDELKDDQKSETTSTIRKKRGKYLRRKGSSGFDYIRKKKKPSSSSNTPANALHNSHNNSNNSSHPHHFSVKSEKMDADEYENKVKTEDDVSREIQKWVLNKGVGQSTMHKAARQGYIDVVVYCLERMNMNPDQKDNAGYTPLHEACTNGWLDIARVLLQYGANHSAAAHSGIRPLHEASENDHEEIVRLLLAYGADPLLATYSGQTPLMLASSTTMRDILNNHLIDVQSMGPERKPWKFNGPWEIYDPSECGYNVFEGAPNPLCDTSRAPFLRKGSSLIINNMLNTTTTNNNNSTGVATGNNSQHPVATQNGPTKGGDNSGTTGSTSNNIDASKATSGGDTSSSSQKQQQPHPTKGETTIKTVMMDKCAVVLDKIDGHFNSLRNNNKSADDLLVQENSSDSDGEMFEFEEADILLPPLYLLKDEGTNDKWVLLSDLCNLLKVKSKDTLLNKIYPQSSSAAAASAHKSLMRELKMSDFLEKATCLQLLCAGEKLNICASKVVLIKYNENVRNLLGVKTILMKF